VNSFDVPIRQACFVEMVGKKTMADAIALTLRIFNRREWYVPRFAGFRVALIGEGWAFLLNLAEFFCGDPGAACDAQSPRLERKPTEDSPPTNFTGKDFDMQCQDRPTRSASATLSMLSLLGLQYSLFLPIFCERYLTWRERLGTTDERGRLLERCWGRLAVCCAQPSYKGLRNGVRRISVILRLDWSGFRAIAHFLDFVCGVVRGGVCGNFADGRDEHDMQNRVPDELRGRVMAVYATTRTCSWIVSADWSAARPEELPTDGERS